MFCITVICNGEEKDCNDIIAPYLDRKPQLNSVERQSYLEWSIGHVVCVFSFLFFISLLILFNFFFHC